MNEILRFANARVQWLQFLLVCALSLLFGVQVIHSSLGGVYEQLNNDLWDRGVKLLRLRLRVNAMRLFWDALRPKGCVVTRSSDIAADLDSCRRLPMNFVDFKDFTPNSTWNGCSVNAVRSIWRLLLRIASSSIEVASRFHICQGPLNALYMKSAYIRYSGVSPWICHHLNDTKHCFICIYQLLYWSSGTSWTVEIMISIENSRSNWEV